MCTNAILPPPIWVSLYHFRITTFFHFMCSINTERAVPHRIGLRFRIFLSSDAQGKLVDEIRHCRLLPVDVATRGPRQQNYIDICLLSLLKYLFIYTIHREQGIVIVQIWLGLTSS